MSFWKDLAAQGPIVALAPMAGYTDSAYRQLIKGIEPRVICFTEFTSADGIVYDSEATLSQLDFNPDEERPLVAQIFGKVPKNFATAAQKIESMGIDAIDINMGCPAKKVVSSDHGSALLKNPCKALEIVEATVKATKLPVSVKMRIGVSELDLPWLIQFAKDLESTGIQLLTIHGRTAKQMYLGKADWQPMYEIKKNLGIPVIGNGDIRTAADALEKIGNLDGVMIGRGTMGNPWVMREVMAAFKGESYTAPETLAEKLPTILRHAELNVQSKGERRGMLEMRKHFASLIKGFEGASDFRSRVVRIETLEEARRILKEVEEAVLLSESQQQVL